MRIFLQGGATACRVGDDGVEIVGVKRGEVCASQIARHVTDAGMRSQRAAANLFGGDDDFTAIRLQHAYGGAIEFAESNLGHAAGEERDSGALLSSGGKSFSQLAEEKMRIDLRQQALAVLQSQQSQNPECASERCESRYLVKPEKLRSGGNSFRIGQQAAIDEISQNTRRERPFVLLFDLSAREFEDFAVLDAGRADAFAVAAIQTAIDVSDKSFADFQAALIDQSHLTYAPARRIRF